MIDFTHQDRLISPSKSMYRQANPDHHILFNANIFTVNKRKLWWGDLDLTLDQADLKRYAREINEELFILSELDGRGGIDETDPELNHAVLRVAPSF